MVVSFLKYLVFYGFYSLVLAYYRVAYLRKSNNE